jgi:hypothetical protein
VTCINQGPLANGASTSVTLRVNVAGTAVPSVANMARVEVTGDLNPTNDSDTDLTEVGRGLHSLAVTGTGFAEVAHAPSLNRVADWTVELWFKDANPTGFEHDYVNLLNKGDRQTARSASDISSSYRDQLDTAERAQVANWRFDEGAGLVAADLVGGLQADLRPGATFSSEVHP